MQGVNLKGGMLERSKDVESEDVTQFHKSFVHHFSSVVKFVESAILMIQFTQRNRALGRDVSGAVFQDMFKLFLRICGLIPSHGEQHKASGITILNNKVTSVADIVILAGDIFASNIWKVSVVSIVEARNMNTNRKDKFKSRNFRRKRTGSTLSGTSDTDVSRYTDPDQQTESSDTDDFSYSNVPPACAEKPMYEEPEIYDYIQKNVLAQHGGDLLLHRSQLEVNFCNKTTDSILCPGMIVNGTKVTLTVLKVSDAHLKEVHDEKVVNDNKSFIYYSQQSDMMIKEDRDILLEMFVRLGNGRR